MKTEREQLVAAIGLGIEKRRFFLLLNWRLDQWTEEDLKKVAEENGWKMYPLDDDIIFHKDGFSADLHYIPRG